VQTTPSVSLAEGTSTDESSANCKEVCLAFPCGQSLRILGEISRLEGFEFALYLPDSCVDRFISAPPVSPLLFSE
jgi:hypothetical protein